MADGKHCPGCGKDIGIWPVFSATLPSRVFCPHCRVRLRYRETLVLFAAYMAVLAVTGAAAWYVSYVLLSAGILVRSLTFLVALVVLFTPLELVACLYLRSSKELEPAESRRSS